MELDDLRHLPNVGTIDGEVDLTSVRYVEKARIHMKGCKRIIAIKDKEIKWEDIFWGKPRQYTIDVIGVADSACGPRLVFRRKGTPIPELDTEQADMYAIPIAAINRYNTVKQLPSS